MHIPDGLLPAQLMVGGYALTGGVTWLCLRQIQRRSDPTMQLPKVALLTAAFFVTSLIHIPMPPASIHLVLNGLLGIVLGYYSFPAILVGLFFQAVMFGHGGISSLGVNALIMGLPALLAYNLVQFGQGMFRHVLWRQTIFFLGGAIAVITAAVMYVIITLSTITPDLNATLERTATLAALVGYLGQGLLEGAFTVMAINFLERVKPEVLNWGEPSSS
ncbi:cobalt transporter CbiM [Spirulina major CS-329]|jgi:cobalt/nickel transport system permease protein|uniref:cobalt transporter CbiM n=1 Tax=Spirulina TaxID=1154 RepID=UPI00232DE01D|nr:MULTISPECIES: cobalt transporter CbiM [Spirulina]MDB9495765.1 cobalt transporter CbiM [Spirulina subsalsa CS-330]MDB9503831.1 cobalt transporter CbiM [Spirulina major CS-329]